jgi:hypothetical protein
MSWLFSAALLPLVLCGAMCFGGVLLAALGLRQGARSKGQEPSHETPAAPSRTTADQ